MNTIPLIKMRERYDYLTETVEPDDYRWDEVDLVIYAFTDLGMKVAINDEYSGLVYGNLWALPSRTEAQRLYP